MFPPTQRMTVGLSGLSSGRLVHPERGTILQQMSTDLPVYQVELLFRFKGVKRVDVLEERIHRS